MKFNINQMKEISGMKNSIYYSIMREFLFHSNKLEGSTFSKDNLHALIDSNKVEGSHSIDDVYETIGSINTFKYMTETLGEPINKRLLFEFHKLLKEGTRDDKLGYTGCYKKYANEIYLGDGKSIKTLEPNLVEEYIEKTIKIWNKSEKRLEDIADFHYRFESIHPFNDGNGRVGRFIIIKQCIENDIDLIVIDSKYKDEYKNILRRLQEGIGAKTELYELFRKCQSFLDDKQDLYTSTLNELNKIPNTEIKRPSLFENLF